eukprot:m.356171 g.356171  ORF g.356171 m.356171 type:complete len:345 (+) comp17453_c0_seq1:97-1131(+)
MTDALSRFKSAGIGNYEAEEADGQLTYHLHSEDETKLYNQLCDALKARREAEAKGEVEVHPSINTESPSYIQDGSIKSQFWLWACLRARKYEVERALELYMNFLVFRCEYGIDDPNDPDHDETLEYLKRKAQRACGNKDHLGRYVLSFDAIPDRPKGRVLVRTVFNLIQYLLVTYPDAQARGTITVGNFEPFSMFHFDSQGQKELLDALTNKLPVRSGGMFMVNAPLIIRSIWPLMRRLMKKKMQDRFHVHKKPISMLKYMDEDQLDVEFGGKFVRTDDCLILGMTDEQFADALKRAEAWQHAEDELLDAHAAAAASTTKDAAEDAAEEAAVDAITEGVTTVVV